MFQIKAVEKLETRISRSVTFFRKSCRLLDNFEKCGGAREVAENMAHVRCMLVKQDYTRTQTHARTSMHSPTRAITPTHSNM